MAEIRAEVRVWIAEVNGNETTVNLESVTNIGDNPRFLPQLATSQLHHLSSQTREMLVPKFGDISVENTVGEED